MLDVRGSAIFNGNGGNYDFRIEGTSESNLFFVDASTNRIGIGTNNPSVRLHVYGKMKLSNPTYPEYIMKSALSGAKEWSFFSSDTGWYLRNRDNGVNPFGITNNAKHNSLMIYPTGVVVNENAYDINFRVESTSNSHMLFVDASTNNVGINTSNPQRALDINGVMRLEPRATFPGLASDGDLCVQGTPGNYHIYCYLNGDWRQLD